MRFDAIRFAINEMLQFRRALIADETGAEEQAEVLRIDALIANKAWRPDSDWLDPLPTTLPRTFRFPKGL